jgi:hypothetical protein
VFAVVVIANTEHLQPTAVAGEVARYRALLLVMHRVVVDLRFVFTVQHLIS